MLRSLAPYFVLLIVFVLAVGSPESAEAARRGRSSYNNAAAAKARKQAAIKAAQAQYAAAESVLQAAQSSGSSATAQLQHVIGVMTQAATDMHEAMSDVKELTKDLHATEEDILREQSADSPYVKVMEELTTIKREMAVIEKRVLESRDYLAEVDRVRASEGPAAVARFRQSTLDQDHGYATLKLKLQSATADVSRIRHELFGADKEWNTIREHVAQAQHAADARSAEVYAHAPDRAQPLEQIKDAKQAMAVASAMKAQAEATLKGLGAKPTSATTSSSKKK